MAYVKVPKDLSKVKTKVALNLTKRQLIGFSIAGLLGFPVYLLCIVRFHKAEKIRVYKMKSIYNTDKKDKIKEKITINKSGLKSNGRRRIE